MKPRPITNRLARWIFRAALAGLWLFVALLAFELVLRLANVWMESQNPLIQADKKQEWAPPPAPEELVARPLSVPPSNLSWADTAPADPLAADWEMPRHFADGEERIDLCRTFLSLDETDRTRFTIAHGLVVLSFDSNGRAGSAYGSKFYVASTMLPRVASFLRAELREEIAESLAERRVLSRRLKLPTHPEDEAADFYLIPDPGNATCFVFWELEYWFVAKRYTGVELGSRWETVDFSYRKNHDDGEGFVTNSKGFRAPEVQSPKPEHVFRIVCIGGSTTANGRDNASTYPALLEAKLRAHFPGKQIEVLNYGVQGIRTRSQFLHVPTILSLEPDLVIGYLGVNDLQLDIPSAYPLPGYPFQALPLFIARRLGWGLPWTVDEKREWIQDLTITQAESLRRIFGRADIRFAICSYAYPHPDALTPEQVDYYRHRGAGNFLYLAEMSAHMHDAIRDYCDSKNVFYIPFSENFDLYETMYDWCHMSHEGRLLKADIIAECLYDYLEEPISALPSRP